MVIFPKKIPYKLIENKVVLFEENRNVYKDNVNAKVLKNRCRKIVLKN